MTDPTVDGWTLPEDLYAAPIVVYPDLPTRLIMDLAKAKGLPDLADRLLVTAARLTLLAHAINPPTHDPNAEEWYVQCNEDAHGPMVRPTAEGHAAWCNDADDGGRLACGPHVVKHVSELGR